MSPALQGFEQRKVPLPARTEGAIQTGSVMIEFKGVYYQNREVAEIKVLVQYDDALLHVWRLSGPFYRIFSSDLFRVAPLQNDGRRIIELPDGAHITTDDNDAIDRLTDNHAGRSRYRWLAQNHKRGLFILGCIVMVLAAWCWLRFP